MHFNYLLITFMILLFFLKKKKIKRFILIFYHLLTFNYHILLSKTMKFR